MQIVEKFCETKFGQICYLEAGQGTKVFYFFHGFWGDPRGIRGLSSFLVPKGYKIIAPYLPGHGKSHSLPPKFNYQDFLEEMEEFVNLTARGSKMVFFGNSFGGGLALNLAQKMREENLDGLVVSVPLLTPVKYQEYPRAFW